MKMTGAEIGSLELSDLISSLEEHCRDAELSREQKFVALYVAAFFVSGKMIDDVERFGAQDELLAYLKTQRLSKSNQVTALLVAAGAVSSGGSPDLVGMTRLATGWTQPKLLPLNLQSDLADATVGLLDRCHDAKWSREECFASLMVIAFGIAGRLKSFQHPGEYVRPLIDHCEALEFDNSRCVTALLVLAAKVSHGAPVSVMHAATLAATWVAESTDWTQPMACKNC